MPKINRAIGKYHCSLGELSDEKLKMEMNFLRNTVLQENFRIDIHNPNQKQIDFVISKDTEDNNVYNPVFYGKIIKSNEVWEFNGKFGYEKIAEVFFLSVYTFIMLLLICTLIMPDLKIIAAGIYCILSYVIVIQIIAHLSSSNKKEEMLEIINRSIYQGRYSTI